MNLLPQETKPLRKNIEYDASSEFSLNHSGKTIYIRHGSFRRFNAFALNIVLMGIGSGGQEETVASLDFETWYKYSR